MSIEGASGPREPIHIHSNLPVQHEWARVKSFYEEAIKELRDRDERHAEVGILRSNGEVVYKLLGKQEAYGSHRVGSVTKTFTTLLALKLIHDDKSMLPDGLNTTCGNLFDPEFLEMIFDYPDIAKEMTLEQLLSHTSGMEYGDHTREQLVSAATLHDRFVQEAKEGRKYRHIVHPGDQIGHYSNAGLAVAGLMLEKAYNDHNDTHLSFAEIIQKELFRGVFNMAESEIKPGPTKDPIQSAAGDMNSSVPDLIKASQTLQQGEQPLVKYFGENWQAQMRQPRDLFGHFGLGCEAGIASITHKGLNRELFGDEERDVSAIVIFPLSPDQPALVAMCDSNALGPSEEGQAFIHELEALIGSEETKPREAEPTNNVALQFYCPVGPNVCFFQGTTYLITDCDPFKDTPEKVHCSLNGMQCILERDPTLDKDGIRGYQDQEHQPWLMIETKDKREIILSNRCLISQRRQAVSLNQPDVETIRAVTGKYRNATTPDAHPTFTFTESGGRLFMREGMGKDYPCLYIPEKNAWVSTMQPTMQFQFPDNLEKGFLMITDIFSGDQELPKECRREEKGGSI